MRIIWDERKRLINLDKHGLDFATLTPEFFEHAVIAQGKRERDIAVGWLDGVGVLVAHVRYGTEAISVVSMRVANVKERRML